MSFLGGIAGKIRNGLDDVGSFLSGAPAHGPNPLGPGQASINNANQQLQQQPPKFGVLADPQKAQSFEQSQANGNGFNPLVAGIGSFTQPFANTAKIPYDLGRMTAASATRNPQALQNASQATTNDATHSLVGFAVDAAKQGVGAAFQPYEMNQANKAEDYTNRVLTDAYGQYRGGDLYASQEASQAKLNLLKDAENNSGISYTDNPINTAAKAVPKIGAGVAQAELFRIPGSLPFKVQAAEGGLLMGGANFLNTSAQDNRGSLPDAAKSSLITATQGAALPIVSHMVGQVAGKAGLNKDIQPLDESGGAKIPSGKPAPATRPLKHYTDSEIAKQLQNGTAFDYSKNPIHGTGSLEAGYGDKFVNDGQPALYLSKDDKTWSVANTPKANPETVNIDHVTPEMMKDGYFQKHGITPQFDYTTQKYVGYKDAFTSKKLTGVDYYVSPNARKLVIDSPAKLQEVTRLLGVHADAPQFWSKLRNQYDVVDIINVDKNKAVEGPGRKFFKAAKADQSIVLNPDVASIKPFASKAVAQPAQVAKLTPMQEAASEINDRLSNIEGKTGKNMTTQPAPEPKGLILSESKPNSVDGSTIQRVRVKDPTTGNVSIEERKVYSPEVKSYAESFNISEQEAAKDLASRRLPVTKSVPNEPAALSKDERQSIIDSNASQQPLNKVDLAVPEGNIKGAIAKATGVSAERDARLRQGEQLIKKLSDHDKGLVYEYDDGMSMAKIKGLAENPEAVAKALTKTSDALDYSLAVDRAAGGSTLRQNNYVPHYYQATPEMMDKLGIPEDQRIVKGRYQGFHDDSAKYPSYIKAGEVGLKPLYDNPADAIKAYRESGNFPIQKQALYTTLQQAAPNEVHGTETVGANGVPLHEAAGTLGFNVSDNVNKYLKNFQKPWEPNSAIGKGVMKGAMTINGIAKKSLFALSPFHYGNVLSNFLGLTVPSGHELVAGKGVGEAVASAVSNKGYQAIVEHYRETGTLEYARNMGIQLSGHGRLHQFSDALGLALSDAARKAGVDPLSKEGTALGAEYNKVIGRTNAAVEGRSVNVQRATGAGTLAPEWTPAQLGLLKDFFNPSKGISKGVGLYNAGDVARSTVIGKRVVEVAIGVIGTAIATGQMPTWKKVVNEAGLNPNNPIPNIEGNATDKKGRKWDVNLPTDPLGLAVGLVKDPAHFLQSRYSPGISSVARFASNKDWNGQPLSDPNDPNATVKRIAGALKGNLPISLQNATNPNLSIKQGLLQDVGLRYKSDPNDPQNVANKNYYDGVKNASNDLKKSGPDGQYWAQQFANLHPTNTTDASGNKYPTPYNPLSSEVKYSAYTTVDGNGNQILSPVFYKDQELSNKTPGYPTSPLYKLNGTGTDVAGNNAPQALVALQYQHAQDPAAKINIMNANGGQTGWLADYESQTGDYSKNYQSNLTDYFKSLGWNQTAVDEYWSKHPSTPDPIDQVNFDKPTTDLINQYYQLSASGDSTGASKFFSDNADVLGPAFDQTAQHANALRAAKGELQIQGYPSEPDHVKQVLSSMPQGSDPASKKARALAITGNPDVNQYLANVALYEALSKGAQFRYKNPANMTATEGENVNNGGQAGQSFLKNTVSLANYDIGKNAVGQYSFMQNGSLGAGYSPAGGGKGGKFYSKKLRIRKLRTPKKYVHRVKAHKPHSTEHFSTRKTPTKTSVFRIAKEDALQGTKVT